MLVTLCMLPLLLGPFVDGNAIDGSTGSADRCAWEAYTKCTRPELFNKMRQAPLFSETKEGQTEFMCPENDVIRLFLSYTLIIHFKMFFVVYIALVVISNECVKVTDINSFL